MKDQIMPRQSHSLSDLREGIAYRRVNRPPREVIEELSNCTVADAHEAMGPVLGYQMLMNRMLQWREQTP